VAPERGKGNPPAKSNLIAAIESENNRSSIFTARPSLAFPMEFQNKAMLAKLGWKILTNKKFALDSSVKGKVSKTWYFS
jgi:hypothetical protein